MLKTKKHKGFTLTEILLVFSLAAIMIISIFVLYSKVSSFVKARQEISNINSMITGIKTLYASSANYVGLSNLVLKNSGFLPDNMIDNSPAGGGVIKNTWGATITVTPQNISTNSKYYTYNAFNIMETGVPANECIKIVSALSSSADIVNIEVNFTYLKSPTVSFNVNDTVNTCNMLGENNIIIIQGT